MAGFAYYPQYLDTIMAETETDRPSGWITLISGRTFDFGSDDLEQINIQDIAHALSRICRWGGHVEEFYSVAQHCVLASQLADAEFALAALMHDASEAYMGDLVRPLKRVVEQFTHYEERIMGNIARRYGFPWPMPLHVKEIDDALLAAEHQQLRGTQDPKVWDPPLPSPWYSRIGTLRPWSPRVAKEKFLDRFYELMAKPLQEQTDMFGEAWALEMAERDRVMRIPLRAAEPYLTVCECGHLIGGHAEGALSPFPCLIDECGCMSFRLAWTNNR